MNATHRSDIRELIALNFAKFEQRLAEIKAEFRAGMAELETRLERRLFAAWATLLIAVIGLWMRRQPRQLAAPRSLPPAAFRSG